MAAITGCGDTYDGPQGTGAIQDPMEYLRSGTLKYLQNPMQWRRPPLRGAGIWVLDFWGSRFRLAQATMLSWGTSHRLDVSRWTGM